MKLTKKIIGENNRIIVNTNTLCELLGVSRTTVKNWADEGCPKHSRGWWDLKEVFEWVGIAGAKEDKETLTNKEKNYTMK